MLTNHSDMRSIIRFANIFANAELEKIFPLPKKARFAKVTFRIIHTLPGLTFHSTEMYFYVLTDSDYNDVVLTKHITKQDKINITFTFSDDYARLFDYLEPFSSSDSDYSSKEYFGRVYYDDNSMDSCNYQRSAFFDNFLLHLDPKESVIIDNETKTNSNIDDTKKVMTQYGTSTGDHSDHFSGEHSDHEDKENKNQDQHNPTVTTKNDKTNKGGMIYWVSTITGLSILGAASVFGLSKLRNK